MGIDELLEDIGQYGNILRAWQGSREVQHAPSAPPFPGPLPELRDIQSFVSGVYALVRTTLSPFRVYRFYEASNLEAPYGRDHRSYLQALVAARNPARRDGNWWSTKRPLSIHPGYSEQDRADDRHYAAVTKKWNRFDFVVEANLPPASLVYIGRIAPQAEDPAYDGSRRTVYGGGAMQVRPIDSSRLQVMAEYRVL